MADKNVGKAVEIVLSEQHKFFKWAIGAAVGYFVSEFVEKKYVEAIVAYRHIKSKQ